MICFAIDSKKPISRENEAAVAEIIERETAALANLPQDNGE